MPIKLPFYAKASLLLVGPYALVSLIYLAQGPIVPSIFAVILSIVLYPIVIILVGLRIDRLLARVTTLIIAFLLVAASGGFFISQGTKFGESFPHLLLFGIEYAVFLAVTGDFLNNNCSTCLRWVMNPAEN